MEAQARLEIAILSDIHLNQKNLDKLKDWYKQRTSTVKFDYLFILGDFASISNHDLEHSPSVCHENEEKIKKSIEFLGFFGCPMLFIPGNHDPPSFFTPDYSMGFSPDKVKNLHKNRHQLAENLQVVGIGGSVPGYWKKAEQQEPEVVWKGYPYATEEDWRKSIAPWLSQ